MSNNNWRFKVTYGEDKTSTEQWGLTLADAQRLHSKEQRLFGYQYKVIELHPHYCRMIAQGGDNKSLATIVISFDGITAMIEGGYLTDVYHEEAQYTIEYDFLDGKDNHWTGGGYTAVTACSQAIAEWLFSKQRHSLPGAKATITKIERATAPATDAAEGGES